MNPVKIYCMKPLTTFINENGEEKKKGKGNSEDHPMNGVLPINWTKWLSDRDENNIDQGYGCIIPTGKRSGITVLDFDTMESYYDAVTICPSLPLHYTVFTRKGRHVYFEYDETIEKYPVENVDTQNDNKGVFGPGTVITRYNGEVFQYKYMGGAIIPMPQILRDKCTTKKGKEYSKFISNVKYDVEVSDEEMYDIINQLEKKFPHMFNDYNEWLKFTMVMKSINKKDIWDDVSSRHENYSRFRNNKIWNGIKKEMHLNYLTNLLGIPSIVSSKKIEEHNSQISKDDCFYSDQKYFDFPDIESDAPSLDSYSHFNDTDVIIIQSGTGTGKTTCVAKHYASYEHLRKEITLLSITNLISLANQQVITFRKKGVNISSYRDDKVNSGLIMCRNSVICINSLHKLHNYDFRNKIIYIDEVHALCQSLTHNNTIKEQRLVFNTLSRALKTCHKVVVSDAHIYDCTMHLLSERIYDGESTSGHYINTYNKFANVPAVKYCDEDLFFEKIKNKILAGDDFSFACDSKDVITKWFDWLWAEASVETQEKMILYTSETDNIIHEDWQNKIIFYSPKISTGVDITVSNQTEQFVYITGKSVSSISLYQMATRTRNMNQLSYYSKCRSFDAKYESREHCLKVIESEMVANCLGLSTCKLDDEVRATFEEKENSFLNIYAENTYVMDYFKTNITRFFEHELKQAGFNLMKDNSSYSQLSNDVKNQMSVISEENCNDKFTKLIESLDSKETVLSEGITQLKKRADILHLDSVELIEEYRDVIEDEYKFEQFLNYGRLKKSYEYCVAKLSQVVNGKMAIGVHINVWNKIKYVHMLAQQCGIGEDLFDLENIVCPDTKKKDVRTLIDTIKVLYRKRDKVKIEDYDGAEFVKLYKFMLDSLVKKLGIVASIKSQKRNKQRNKHSYGIDTEASERYDRLISIMNPTNNVSLDCFDEE